MASDVMKRVVRKAKRIAGLSENKGIEIKSSGWILEKSIAFEAQTKKSLNVEIISDIQERKAYPRESMAIEYAIDSILESGEYTERKILVIQNPYQRSPLCALAVFCTSKPYKVKIKVKGKTKDCDITYIIPKNTQHRVPIMGLYPNYENTIILTLLDDNGHEKLKRKIRLKTAPLKGKSENIKITKEKSSRNYLYNLTLVYGGDDGVFPYAFDKNGDVRYCFSMVPKTYGFQPISKGKFLFLNKGVTRTTATNPTVVQMYEVDQMGRICKMYNIEKGVHHEFIELSDGNLVMASNAIEGGTFEDSVIEIDRATGQIVNEIEIKDYVDHKYVDSADWAHLNSIYYNKEEKTVVLSLRNIHTVLKLNYEKKELEWILGNPQFWEGSESAKYVLKPDDNMEWFFQQHAAYYIDENLDGNPNTRQLIIYDNHTHKRRPVDYYDQVKKSFVRIYSIDEQAKTVSLLKTFPLERSSIRSNAIYEPRAKRIMAMSGKLAKGSENRKGKIEELDYNTGEVLNSYLVNNGFYRAYQFKFATEKMAKRMECDENYTLGKLYELHECDRIDTSNAKTIPQPVLEEQYATEEERQNELVKIAKKNPETFIDPEQDMARISYYIKDDVLYIRLLDHFLERLYLVGKENCYFRDYTDTKQERPEYFARTQSYDPIPLGNLKSDEYEIFFAHSIGLYKSGEKIKIRKKEVHN